MERIEGIVRESVRPLEKIEGIKILHVDGVNGGSSGRNVTDEVINSALRYRVQAPMIDTLMKEIGIEGGSLGRMTDVLRDAKDISALTRDRKGREGKAGEAKRRRSRPLINRQGHARQRAAKPYAANRGSGIPLIPRP